MKSNLKKQNESKKFRDKKKKIAKFIVDNENKIFLVGIGIIILFIIFFSIIFHDSKTVEEINNKKIDISKIKLSMSNDYKYFNNSVYDFAAVIVNRLKSNEIEINSNTKCEYEGMEFCQKIVLDNYDKIYLIGNNNDNFEKIIVMGNINDFKYAKEVLRTIAELYIEDLDGNEFDNEINLTLLSEENLKRDKGLSYVYSHMKFDWIKENNFFRLELSATEYENYEQYKESDEYKNAYNDILKNNALNEIKSQMNDSHTLDSYEINNETGLVDVKIKYEKDKMSKYSCAEDTQYMAKSLVGSKSIGSLQFECINETGTIYYVKIENINAITTNDINNNTKFFDTNYIQDNTTLSALKDLAEAEFKKSCATYNYKDVLRSPDDYYGERAYWFGEILQVVSNTSYSSTYRVGVSCKKYQYISGYSCPDAIYVTYYGNKNFIEDDMVKMYGTMNGTQSYITVLGATMTIPSFIASYIDLQ